MHTTRAAISHAWQTRLNAQQHGQVAAKLLHHALVGSTREAYDRHWARFLNYCASSQMSPLPASLDTTLSYIGHLFETSTIQATSLQPYLSAINTMHSHLGLEPPAVGPLVQAARRGYGNLRAAAGRPTQRLWLPATAAQRALQAGLETSDLTLKRAHLFVALGFTLFQRESTTTAALRSDIQITDDDLLFKERFSKGKNSGQMRVIRLPRRHHAGLAALLQDFRSAVEAAGGCRSKSFFALPGDKAKLTAAVGDAWVRQSLRALNVVAPEGYTYSSHSLRKGAATAAHAIGVPLTKICYYGNWSAKSRVVHDYIDPSAEPTPAAYSFFGWLLPQAATQAAGPAAL